MNKLFLYSLFILCSLPIYTYTSMESVPKYTMQASFPHCIWIHSPCALVVFCLSVLVRRITAFCFFDKASLSVINLQKQPPVVQLNATKTTSVSIYFLFLSLCWITGQTDVACEQKASRVDLLMKRNGCRVNVIHCGQGIKWDEAERDGRVKETKHCAITSLAMKIISAAMILMDPILCLCQALSSWLSLSASFNLSHLHSG